MRILVAEDDAVSSRILERALTKWGHEVTIARDGEEGWRLYEEGDFRLVITDWMMPGCDGVELCRRIRKSATGKYCYIIMETARTLKVDLLAALEAGVDDFISKPVDFEELQARLRSGTRIVQLEQELATRLEEESFANRQMRADLDAAAMMQRALLPGEMLKIPGLRWAWTYQPCSQVAGDILNLFPVDEGRVGLYVLDVSGHGVSAAMLAVTVSRFLSPSMDGGGLVKKPLTAPPFYEVTPPATVASMLNARFQMDPIACQYFTMIYGALELKSGLFRYAQAGHPAPILMRPGEDPQDLGPSDPPIGFFPNLEFRERTLEFTPGSRLFLYSDGVVEARDSDAKQFGFEGLLAAIKGGADLPLEDALMAIRERVGAWIGREDFEDDFTILGLEME